MSKDKLKKRRMSAGLTQKIIAEKIGINEVSYNRKETGKREFSLSEAKKISIVLSLNEDEVLDIFFKD